MYFKNIFKIFVIVLLFSLVISIVNAGDIDFDLYKTNYKAFETVQIGVLINNISLSRDLEVANLVLLSQDNSSISLAKNKVKVNNSFYVFYFDLPNLDASQYGVGLFNVNYIKDGTAKIGDFFTSLNFVDGNLSIISIRPAYVYTIVAAGQEASFTLVVSNRGTDTLNVDLTKDGDFFNFDTSRFILAPGATRNINVITSLFSKNGAIFNGVVNVNYGGGYLIPFKVIRTGFAEPTITNTTQQNNTRNLSSTIDLSNIEGALHLTNLANRPLTDISADISVGEYYPSGQVVVRNSAGVDLHNLNFYISGATKGMFDLQPDNSNVLVSNDSLVFIITINNSYGFVSGFYDGYLNVNSSEGASASVPMYINITTRPSRNYTNIFNTTSTANVTGNLSPVQYGEQPESKGNYALWVFLIVIVVLFIVVYLIYKKTKPKQKAFESFVDKVKGRRTY